MIELRKPQKKQKESKFSMKKKKGLTVHRVHKSTKKQKKNVKNVKNVKSKIVVKKYKKRVKKPTKITPVETPVAIKQQDIEPIIVPTTTDPAVVIPKKRGRKSKNGATSDKMYFTKETEDFIIEYNATSDIPRREYIYNNKIKYPFEKLVENIFNTFKFSYFETGPLDVQKETVSHLVSNIHKFEAGKGKAFSYFSIIAKHYLIALNNSTYKRRNQHVEISEEHSENTIQLQTEDSHHKAKEMREFIDLMIQFWETNIGKIFTKQRDLDIANGVIELFRNTQNISMFNKKALYLYIREISNCKTQQITKVINRMKQYQTNISRSYINRGVINTKNYIKS